MDVQGNGIVSYAGLTRETLLSHARAAFIQAEQPVPHRFEAFLPLFPAELVQNMDYMGPTEARGAMVAPSGFSIDPAEYHRKMHMRLPALYEGDNYGRNFDYEGRFIGRGAFTVDRAVADHFPQYSPFMGEKLSIYLIGGGFQAVAVPESVYPRGGGLIGAQERAMGVSARVEMILQYFKTRMAAGELYDADAFTADYLRVARLSPVTFAQEELSRILQDLSIVKSLQSDGAGVGLYTQSARKAERVFQYVPMRYACDLFAPEAVDKHTARLVQLHYADADDISDLWIPWQDFAACVDRRTTTLNVRALCEGFQIAPRYDPDTFGGRYPDRVRVAAVRDRDLPLMVGEAINNPAYGSGMGPQGTIGRHVYIADSHEMLRQRKLVLDEVSVTAENDTLPPDAYRKCLMLAVLQEHKGRLVDAMYRRETVLRQIDPATPVYAKAVQLLDERVKTLEEIVRREAKQSGMSQMSGYDADIDYLARKRRDREGEPDVAPTGKPIAFAPDPLREQSIESGYAMRAGLVRMKYAEAALPEPPAAPPVGADDSEDEPGGEHLPPIASAAMRPSAATPNPTSTATASASKPVSKPVKGGGSLLPVKPAAPAKPAGTGKPVAQAGSQTHVAQPGTGPEKASVVHPTEKSPGLVTRGIVVPAASVPFAPDTSAKAAHAEPDMEEKTTPSLLAGGDGPEGLSGLTSGIQTSPEQAMQTVSGEPKPQPEADIKPEETHAEPSAPAAEPAAPRLPMQEEQLSFTALEPAQGDVPDAQNPAAAPASDGGDAPPPPAKPTRVGRVSLRELSRRIAPEPETPPESAPEPPAAPETPAPEEKPTPKLAYIARRGSEGAATQSYSRMSEMLKKKEK